VNNNEMSVKKNVEEEIKKRWELIDRSEGEIETWSAIEQDEIYLVRSKETGSRRVKELVTGNTTAHTILD